MCCGNNKNVLTSIINIIFMVSSIHGFIPVEPLGLSQDRLKFNGSILNRKSPPNGIG